MIKLAFFAAVFSLINQCCAQKIVLHNPVLNKDFPDPTVIKAADGKYYAYATQGDDKGKMMNIQVASSNNLINWKPEGNALPQKPVWAHTTQDFWAPHVLYDSVIKQYVMFFSAESDDTATDKCLGVAFSKSPKGPFIDKGTPLVCGKSFVNIDPMALTDPLTKKKILYWGSGFQPLKVQELTDDWKDFKSGSEPKNIVFPGKDKSYSNLLEGSWLDYANGKYYLYYSGDNCCGDRANYAVMVAKADSAFGPFTRLGEANGIGHSEILQKDSTWIAPGHNSIVRDNKGNIFIAYHAIWRDKAKQGKATGPGHYVKRVMCIRQVKYENGWPKVE